MDKFRRSCHSNGMTKARPGPRNLITDVPGLTVGQARDEAVRTGVTVILHELEGMRLIKSTRGLVKVLGVEQEIAGLGDRMALDLSQEGNRWAARYEISALFRPWFMARTLAEVAPLFDAAGLTWSIYRKRDPGPRRVPLDVIGGSDERRAID